MEIETNFLENLQMELNKEKENIFFLMVMYIGETGDKTKKMDMGK